jgi:hypothetical protein
VSGHGDSIRERRARESWPWSKWEEGVDEYTELDYKVSTEQLWEEYLLEKLD